MIKFHNAPHPALSYAAITVGPGPLVDPALVLELEKLERINSSLRAEKQVPLGPVGDSDLCVFINHLGAGGVLRSYDMKKVSINTELLEEMIGRPGDFLEENSKESPGNLSRQTLFSFKREDM